MAIKFKKPGVWMAEVAPTIGQKIKVKKMDCFFRSKQQIWEWNGND